MILYVSYYSQYQINDIILLLFNFYITIVRVNFIVYIGIDVLIIYNNDSDKLLLSDIIYISII